MPDPNWELELHGPSGGRKGPDSKDEMLAHALLRPEPDPLEADDFGDFERSTLPPPEAMSVHVARMMAQAALLEGLDDEGDRPTPLLESDPLAATRKVPAVSDPLAATRKAPAARASEGSRKGVAALRFDSDRKDTPLIAIDPAGLHGGSAFAEVERKLTPVVRFEQERPSDRGAASRPADRERPSTQEPLSLSRLPASQGAADLSDLSDLPAVFSLDGLSLDEPVSDAAVSPSLLAETPVSEPAISPPFASLDPVDLSVDLDAPQGPPAETMAAIEARFEAGDYARALVLAESALIDHPGDPAITHLADGCRENLYRRYLERLGAADHIPRLAMNRSALTGLTLDHRAGFLLSCVDGGSTLEEIIDVSAMPRLDAVRILYELVQEGVIEMVSPR